MFNIIYQSLGKCKSKSQLKYYFTLFRMAIIKMFSKKKKNKNKKCWQGEINSTAIETLVHSSIYWPEAQQIQQRTNSNTSSVTSGKHFLSLDSITCKISDTPPRQLPAQKTCPLSTLLLSPTQAVHTAPACSSSFPPCLARPRIVLLPPGSLPFLLLQQVLDPATRTCLTVSTGQSWTSVKSPHVPVLILSSI